MLIIFLNQFEQTLLLLNVDQYFDDDYFKNPFDILMFEFEVKLRMYN